MRPPDISVIIPTRNRPGALARCLESLADQAPGTPDFEVLVVDDASTFPPDVERFRSRLELHLLHQAHAGPGVARNLGLSRARGGLVAFTDDDCRPDSRWLAEMRIACHRWPDALVGGRVVNALKDDWYARVSHEALDMVYEHFNEGPAGPSFFTTNNLAGPAAKLRELGGFDPFFTIAAAEDRDLCRRWKARGWMMHQAPAAIVRHFHASSLREFCSMHFRYGRGACLLHRRHRDSPSTVPPVEAGFHQRLPGRVLSRLTTVPGRQRLPLIASLFVWQVAGLAGFAFECLNRRQRPSAHD